MKRTAYARLPTEQTNPGTRHIDRLSTPAAVRKILLQERGVSSAAIRAGRSLAKAVERVAASLARGGRLFFVGAGTSGRLGVMEAAECPPTFNTPPGMIQAIMAGGRRAVFRSQEGAEDREGEARREVRRRVRRGDVVVGVAASGITPFVGAALREARRRGARTVLVTCNPRFSLRAADVIVAARTGPEAIAGSTRLKAGTCTKILLNALTTATMIRLGKIYGHWMVDLQPRSRKLRARAAGLVSRLGKVPPGRAVRLLRAARGRAKTAILMARTGLGRAEAERHLRHAGGRLGTALGRDGRE